MDALGQEYLNNPDYYDNSDYRDSLRFGELGNQLYMQIDMLAMPERATGITPVEHDKALKAVVDEQMELAVDEREGFRVESRPDINEKLFRRASVQYLAFFAVAASDNRMLKELVAQYADVLGERMIGIYQHSAACQ